MKKLISLIAILGMFAASGAVFAGEDDPNGKAARSGDRTQDCKTDLMIEKISPLLTKQNRSKSGGQNGTKGQDRTRTRDC